MKQYTAEQTALKAHIEAENAAFAAKCEAEGVKCYSQTTSDLDHWADCDVRTIEQYERYMLICSISDMSKELHGFRVRYDWDKMSTDDLRKEEQSYFDGFRLAEEAEQKREAERKAMIAERNREWRNESNIMAQAFKAVK